MLDRISHYRINRKIGEGGMGVVYAAHDERLGRPVAIKTIRGACDSLEARSRFWREARALARINHPHICQIFEVAEEAGILYLVLEYLEGCSLEDRLHSGRMAVEDALEVAQQILAALDALHNLNIIHRDLKPSNIFLTPGGVKLLDFGLARCFENSRIDEIEGAPTATHITKSGALVGTPQYMAPEQINGESVGPFTDLFAAACVIYHMIAGRRAFDADSSIDVLHAVLHDEPPRLAGTPAVSALGAIIARAIEKRPQDRFSSAKEMANALRAIQPSGESVHIQSKGVSRFIAMPFRLLRNDDDAAFLAYSLPDAITNSLSGIDSLIVRSSVVAMRFEGNAPDLKRIAKEADVNVVLTGTLLRAGEQLRASCQLIEAPSGDVIWSDMAQFSMADIFQLQDNLTNHIVQSLLLPLTERERKTLKHDVPGSPSAYELYLRANRVVLHRNVENMKLGRDLYLQCVEQDASYAPAWARLGRCYRFIEKFGEETKENFQLADAAYRRAFALNPDLAVAHNFYTTIQADLGQAPEAMARLLARARFKRHDPELFAGLVQACRYCGELQASIAAHERAKRLDPNIATSISHTHFLLCAYQKILAGGYYLDAAAMASLGREEGTVALLREREKTSRSAGAIGAMMQSLRALLEGDRILALRYVDEIEAGGMKDPESLFYTARHLARLNEHDRAVDMLLKVIDQNFICDFSLAHDPWLSPLRSHPRFELLSCRASERRREAHDVFVASGGEQLLQPEVTPIRN
jgi:serine/threonine protein kinase